MGDLREATMETKAKKTDPFIIGYESFLRGKTNCPFRVGRFYHKEWNRGFNTAYFDNLKRNSPQTKAIRQA